NDLRSTAASRSHARANGNGASGPDVGGTASGANHPPGASPWPLWVTPREQDSAPDPVMEERLEKAIRIGLDTVTRLQEIARTVAREEQKAGEATLRSLILLENALRVRLGELLAAMSDLLTWNRLG